ncbi:MAG: adenosine kinase [Spirochaetales bacterium]|nr:adenosine kinase [Spirochaetales bacterium]
MYSIFGLGNPLLDLIAPVDFQTLEWTGAARGTMNLVDGERMREILGVVSGYTLIPGGSCANTLRGISWLRQARGGASAPLAPAIYCGAVGEDELGERYQEILERVGVVHRLVRKPAATGCSLILVTPDYERTMFTHLGACRQYGWSDLDMEALEHSSLLYFTGFMWDTESQKEAVMLAIDRARALGIPIAFDLADPFAVTRSKSEFLGLVPSRVDVLFGNREEYRMMFGHRRTDLETIQEAGRFCATTLMKVGHDGCYLNDSGRVQKMAGFQVDAVDTTAAGDCFAAGFLYGRLTGRTAAASARLANRLAAAIVTVHGCDFSSLDPLPILSAGE